MATFGNVTIFLILVISSVHSYPGAAIFSLKGGEATFRVLSVDTDSTLLYKMTEKGRNFVKNSSDPTQSPDLEQSERVNVFFKPWSLPYFMMRNLSVSDSGQYITEICKFGICSQVTDRNLTVCEEKLNVTREEVDGVLEWTINDVNQSQGDFLQMYQDTHTVCDESKVQLILDTKSSFEILPESMKRKVKVLTNGSSVYISQTPSQEDQAIYHILLWKGDQCQLYSETMGNILHAYDKVDAFQYFPKSTGRFACECHSNIKGPVRWFRRETSEEIQQRQTFNLTNEQNDTDVYVDTRNYSLVFPSANPDHSGLYCCFPAGHPQDMIGHYIYPPFELNSTYLTFSIGDTAVLRCFPDSDSFWVSEWLRQSGQEQEELIVDILGPEMVNIREDMRGRVNISQRNSSLIISTLTAEDSGVYRCRGWIDKSRDIRVYIQRIHLICKDPLGVDSMFYRMYVLLMGFGLLLMICAVVSMKWRLRVPSGMASSDGSRA